MKTWKIPVVWQMAGYVYVEANTLSQAIDIAKDESSDIQIPDNGSYLDGSWEVDCFDEDYLRNFYNNGQNDEKEYGNSKNKYEIAKDVDFENFCNALKLLDVNYKQISEEKLIEMFNEHHELIENDDTYNSVYNSTLCDVLKNNNILNQL